MMFRYLVFCAIGVVLLFSTATAWAQPKYGADMGVGVQPDFKSPPLRDSDNWFVPFAVHYEDAAGGLPYPNWAGAIVRMHVLDNTEVDVDAIRSPYWTAPLIEPFGPRSDNRQSDPVMFTVWDPNAQNSGIDLHHTENVHLFDLELHAKNTVPSNNSDVDVTLGFWNIHHLKGGPGSNVIDLNQSDWVYGNAGTNPIGASHFPTDPPAPGQGMWFHLTQPKPFHTVAGHGSAFYATLANTGMIGIEHVPEPTGMVLVICGAGAAGMAWIIRRRRKQRMA